MDDHMTLLHDHFLFQGAEELLHEAQSLGVSRFSRGDTICDPATAGRALGIVLEGRAEAVAPTREKCWRSLAPAAPSARRHCSAETGTCPVSGR